MHFPVRKILSRIFGPDYENGFGWRMRHNEQLYELLDGPDIVKYINFKILQCASHIVWMDNTRIPKTHQTGPVRRPWQRWEDIWRDSLLLLNIRGWRGQGYLGVNYWRGQGLMWAVTTLKNKTFISVQICSCTEILNKLWLNFTTIEEAWPF